MPFQRHLTVTSPTFGARRHSVTTLISDVAGPGSEPSSLLIRRRLPADAPGSRFVLYGRFDASVRPRLLSALAALPSDDRPLAVDLTNVVSLDRDTLHLLLGAHAPGRTVLFRVAASGTVRRLIVRMGLEERMGLTAGGPPEVAVKVPVLPPLSVPPHLTHPALLDSLRGVPING